MPSRYFRLFVLLLLALLVALGCSTTSPAERLDAQWAERADERAGNWSALLPNETRLIASFDPEFFEDRTNFGPAEQLAWLAEAPLEDLDEDRRIVGAVAATGATDYLQRAWLTIPSTDHEQLPKGLHGRLLLPAADPDDLAEDIRKYCGDHRTPCHVDAPTRTTGDYVVVDILAEAFDEERQRFYDDPPPLQPEGPPEILDTRTPALHAALTADDPVSVYSTTTGLVELLTLVGAIEVLETLGHTRGAQERLPVMFRHEQLARSIMLSDPEAAEFQDLAAAIRFAPSSSPNKERSSDPEDPDFGAEIDVVRSYTERGRNFWTTDDNDRNAHRSLSVPELGFTLYEPPTDTDRSPAWASDPYVLRSWARLIIDPESDSAGSLLAPLVEHPAGPARTIQTLVADSDLDLDEALDELVDSSVTVEFDDHPDPPNHRWEVRLGPELGTDGAGPRLTSWLEERFDATERYFAARGWQRGTHEVARIRLGDDSVERPPPLYGFDTAGFEPTVPDDPWRGCMGAARIALTEALEGSDMTHPETRLHRVNRALDDVFEQLDACRDEHPSSPRDSPNVRGSWDHLLGTWFVQYFDLAAARPHFETGCERDFEPACREAERLEGMSDFQAIPAVPGVAAELGLRNVRAAFVTDRGLFDDGELAVDADQLHTDPIAALESFVKTLETDDVPVAVDGVTDADLVASVFEGLRSKGLDPSLNIFAQSGDVYPHRGGRRARSPYQSSSSPLQLYRSSRIFLGSSTESNDEPTVALRIDIDGIAVNNDGEDIPPIEGCPPDGPTICTATEPDAVAGRLDAIRDDWSEGDTATANEKFDELILDYQLPELYELLHEIGGKNSEKTSLEIRAARNIPISVVTRIAPVVRYQRQESTHHSIGDLVAANLMTETRPGGRETWVPLFNPIVLVPD